MKFLSRHAVTSLALISFMTTFSICQAERYRPREAFAKDKWGYIEQEFKTKVDDCKHIYVQEVSELCLECVGFVCGGYLGWKMGKDRTMSHLYSPMLFHGKSTFMLLGGLSGVSISDKIAEFIKKRIKHDVAFRILKKFLKEWPDNKPYTPEELHATFEKLKEKYEARGDRGDEWLREVSNTVVKDIRSKHILAFV